MVLLYSCRDVDSTQVKVVNNNALILLTGIVLISGNIHRQKLLFRVKSCIQILIE